jgi:uncharacterized damage-inducible protein DinB
MEIKDIINSLEEVHKHSPWYGNNLSEVLESLITANPNASFNGSNSLGQILEHMIPWKKFVLEKLNGNEVFDIEINSIQDWNKRKIYSKEEFIELIQQFKTISKKLIDALKKQSDGLLLDIVPEKKYNFKTMLEGIIQHDLYHSGQLSLLKRG